MSYRYARGRCRRAIPDAGTAARQARGRSRRRLLRPGRAGRRCAGRAARRTCRARGRGRCAGGRHRRAPTSSPGRVAWLADQIRGLRVYAGVLAGEEVSYSDEIEGCYGIRPELGSEAAYAEAHEQLDELLPGSGRSTTATRHGGRSRPCRPSGWFRRSSRSPAFSAPARAP